MAAEHIVANLKMEKVEVVVAAAEKMKAVVFSRGFFLLKIFSLIESSFCLKLALLILSLVT